MNMKTVKLKIKGIHCASCGKVITMDLEEVDGVGKVEIDEATKLAEIEFDETKVKVEKILETVKNSGYEPAVA